METIKAQFQVMEQPARQLAYIRHVGPYRGDAQLFARLFGQVMRWLQAMNLMGPGREAITVYHDDPEAVPAEEQRISVGFTVPLGTAGAGDIKMMVLPAGKYAVGSFEIDAEDYGEAWGETYARIGKHRLAPRRDGPMYEAYRNDPHRHPEGKHQVDICVALAG